MEATNKVDMQLAVRHAFKQADGHASHKEHMQIGSQAGIQATKNTCREAVRQAWKPESKQTERQSGIHTSRQTDVQATKNTCRVAVRHAFKQAGGHERHKVVMQDSQAHTQKKV